MAPEPTNGTNVLKFAAQQTTSELGKLSVAIAALSDKLEIKSRPNWPFMGTLIGAFIALMIAFPGGALYIVRGDIEHATSPINSRLEAISANLNTQRQEIARLDSMVTGSAQADAQSRVDREQLNRRVENNQDNIAVLGTSVREMDARFSAALAEIESQFHSVSDIGNIHLAQQNRMNAIMWEKLNPGQRFPSDIFFPSSIFNQTPLSGSTHNGKPK
jgi:hypothetical protein